MLPGALLKPITDHWQALLFQYVDGVCSAYCSARTAAELFPDIGDDYLNLFLRENISPTIAALATILIVFSTCLLLALEWLRGRNKAAARI
jgi:hypothetical protein